MPEPSNGLELPEPEVIRWAWIDAAGLCTGAGTCAPGADIWAQANVPAGQTFMVGRPAHVLAGWGWVYDAATQTWSQPPPPPTPLADLKAAKLAALGAQRWQATQTVTYDGVVTQADGAMAAVTAAVVLRQTTGATDPITWKLADGELRSWGTPELVAFGAAVGAHIQACFDREAALTVQVQAALDAAALDAIDITAGWPI